LVGCSTKTQGETIVTVVFVCSQVQLIEPPSEQTKGGLKLESVLLTRPKYIKIGCKNRGP